MFNSDEKPLSDEIKVDSGLDYLQKVRLDSLINKHNHVFSKNEFDLSYNNNQPFNINTEDKLPIRQRAYRVSEAAKEKITKHINELLDLNIIEKSNSPWSSLVPFVKNKDDTHV